MNQLCKQTYLYTAFKAAIQDLGLQKHADSLQNTLLTLLQAKFETIVNKEKEKKQEIKKSVAQTFNASQILQSQFPLGNEEQNVMKYSSILYDMEIPKIFTSQFKVKKNQICMLECYSDQNIKEKGKAMNKKVLPGTINSQKTGGQLSKIKGIDENGKSFSEIKSTIQGMIKLQNQRQKKKQKERKFLLNKRKRSIKKSQKSLTKNQKSTSLNKSLVKKKN